jgi:ribulose kinase
MVLEGNRSPIADPRMRGSIVGLTLVSFPLPTRARPSGLLILHQDSSLHDLARKYALALEAIALQTRHIIDKLNNAGHSIRALYVSGSQAQNAALMRLLANTCNMPVILPRSHSAAVVLGAAMLGRFATMHDPPDPATALWDVMQEMTPPGTVVRPAAGGKEKKLLEVKYRIFLESIEIQRRWRNEIDAIVN